MFKENDYVMYKNNVCKVREIKHNDLNGNSYYILIPIDDESLIIDVPTDNRMGHLRSIVSHQEAEEIINYIKDIEPLQNINDKNIENTYKELIYNGTHNDLVKIIKTSYLRNQARKNDNKKISEKDSKYFELAEKYLYNELSIALNKSFTETKEYIINSMNRETI